MTAFGVSERVPCRAPIRERFMYMYFSWAVRRRRQFEGREQVRGGCQYEDPVGSSVASCTDRLDRATRGSLRVPRAMAPSATGLAGALPSWPIRLELAAAPPLYLAHQQRVMRPPKSERTGSCTCTLSGSNWARSHGRRAAACSYWSSRVMQARVLRSEEHTSELQSLR